MHGVRPSPLTSFSLAHTGSFIMPNAIRPTAATELKDALSIVESDPHGWWAIHTALSYGASRLAHGDTGLPGIARDAIRRAADAGFGQGRPDPATTRYTAKRIMAWQDALYVVNELPEWRFPDEVLLIGWFVECGGPEMGRGPARSAFRDYKVQHYVGGTRALYNKGDHGNGPGWPLSSCWSPDDCRYMNA